MREETRKQYLKLMGIELYRPAHELHSGIVTSEEADAFVEEPVSELATDPETAVSVQDTAVQAPPIEQANTSADDDLMSYMAMDQALPESDDEEPQVAKHSSSTDELSGLDWEQLQQRIAECEKCSLCQSRTQTVFGVGNNQADVMVIGEAPGAEEDKQGKPFVGAAGKLLDNMLKAIGLDRENVFIANILKCRPPANRNPSNEEAIACEGYLLRQIDLIQPKLILSVGGISAKNLLKTEEAVGRLRQQRQQMVKRNIPVLVTYHPAYLLRKPSEKAKSWEDLKKFKQMMKDLI